MLDTLFAEIRAFVNKLEDDLVDRYNHRYTVVFISFFIFVIGSKQYFGEAINCWTPATFTGSHDSYANTIW